MMNRWKRIVLAVMIVMAAVCLSSCQESREKQYQEAMNKAEELLLQKQYAEAAAALDKVPDDERAVQLARYCLALEAGENGDYGRAAEFFQALKDFRDSEKMYSYYLAKQCEAGAREDDGKYVESLLKAAEQFELIAGFRDSNERQEACRQKVYQYAMKLAEEKNYDDSAEVFTLLGEYKDSAEQAQKVRADALYDAGKQDEAIDIYSELNSDYQTHAEDYLAAYKTASGLMDEGKYEEAKEIFTGLGDYKNSEKMITECDYLRAGKLLEEKRYDEAEEIFTELDDYRDSVTQTIECRFRKAKDLTAERKYRDAIDIFDSLHGYRDSDELSRQAAADEMYDNGDIAGAVAIYESLEEAYRTHLQDYENRYAGAEKALADGDYDTAREGYLALGGYRDCADKAVACLYGKAGALMEQKEYDAAAEIYTELGDYQDSAGQEKECRYRKALDLTEAKKYDEASALFAGLSNYRDSIKQEKECRYRKASDLMEAKKHDEAAAVFAGLGNYRDSAEMITECAYRKALDLAEQQSFPEAAAILDTLEDYRDSRSRAAAYRAEQALNDGKYGDAVTFYAQITDESYPREREKEAYYGYGQALLKNKEYTAAADAFRAAGDYRNAAELNKESWIAAGDEKLAAGAYEEARKCYAAAGNEEKTAGAWHREAEAQLAAGKYEEARNVYRRAGMTDKVTETWNLEAESLLAKGRYGEARDVYGQAGMTDKVTETWNLEGETLLAEGRYGEARHVYEQAGMTDKITAAWNLEADALLAEGKYEETRDVYLQAGMTDKIPGVWNLEAEALLAEGDYTRAKEAFLKAENRERYEDTVFEEANTLMAAGDYSGAYDLFTTISGREGVEEILRSEEAFISFRIRPGDVIAFGSFEQDGNSENGAEAIEWIVLAVEDNNVFLLSKYGLDCRPYNLKKAHVSWKTCTLRAWLNNEFLESAFTETERAAILTAAVDNSAGQGNERWSIPGGANTKDQVFLLSYRETETYVAEADRICVPTTYAAAQGAFTKTGGCWWWMRSPGPVATSAARVGTDGARGNQAVTEGAVCVRPAVWIDAEAAGI